jgi:ATP-dependent Clp protease ATP-binding subunit ClpA
MRGETQMNLCSTWKNNSGRKLLGIGVMALLLVPFFNVHAEVFRKEDNYIQVSHDHAEFLTAKGYKGFTKPDAATGTDVPRGGIYFTSQKALPQIDFTAMEGTVELFKDPTTPQDPQNPKANPLLGFVGRVPLGNGEWETWFLSVTNKKIKLASANGTRQEITGNPPAFISADDGIFALTSSNVLWFVNNLSRVEQKKLNIKNTELLHNKNKIVVSAQISQTGSLEPRWVATDDGSAVIVHSMDQTSGEGTVYWVHKSGKNSKVILDDQTILQNFQNWQIVPEGLMTVEEEGTAPNTTKKVFIHVYDTRGNLREKRKLFTAGPSDQVQLAAEGVRLIRNMNQGNPAYYYITKEGHLIPANNSGPNRPKITATDEKTLLNYGRDLLKQAKAGKYDPIYGRDDFLEKVTFQLGGRKNTGIIIHGQPGVGKTAIVEELALRLAFNDRIPEHMRDYALWEIKVSMVKRYASAQQMEPVDAFAEIIDAARGKKIILFIDDIDRMVNYGGEDFTETFRTVLAEGEVLLIGAVTSYAKVETLDDERAFMRSVKENHLEELDKEMTMFIMKVKRHKLEAYYLVHIKDVALQQILWAARKYYPYQSNPRKVLVMLEELAARYSYRLHKDDFNDIQDVGRDQVWEYLAKAHQVINGPKYLPRVLNLVDLLNERVIGQMDAKRALQKTLLNVVTGVQPVDRPLGTFLFVGPTGVGKSYTVKQLAEIMEWPIINMDMQTFVMQDLVDQVLGTPSGIILLEDIHNAREEQLRALMPILEEGEVVDPSNGEKVNFRNMLIVMTSNHKAQLILDNPTAPVSVIETMIQDALTMPDENDEVAIPPEVWGRIDEIVVYRGLSEDELFKVGDILVRKVQVRVKATKGVD